MAGRTPDSDSRDSAGVLAITLIVALTAGALVGGLDGHAESAKVDSALRGNSGMTDIRLDDHFTGVDKRLAEAAAQGDAGTVKRLVAEGANPNAVSAMGMPLIAWPLHVGQVDGVTALLANGADPQLPLTAADGRGQEPVIAWAARLSDPAFLKAFLDHGGDANSRGDADGQVPLIHIARRQNNWEGVQLLVQRGADINAPGYGDGGNTVLSFYAGIGAWERALWLIEHGADPGRKIDSSANPDRVGRQPILENLYWRPTDPKRYPDSRQVRERLWLALAQRGFRPPPEPDDWRELRQKQGYPRVDPNDFLRQQGR